MLRDSFLTRPAVAKDNFLHTAVLGTYSVQAAVCVIGLGMAWQAIECGLLRHHGHSMLCAIGVLINCITFEIAENARAYARAALGI